MPNESKPAKFAAAETDAGWDQPVELISRRVYKPAFSQEKSIAIMREGRGSHFDPDILDAFLVHTDEFKAIADRFADHDADVAAGEAKLTRALGERAPE